MSQIQTLPSTLSGEVFVPSSKSQTLRALLFAALADGVSKIDRPLFSPDTVAMVEACRLLGAQISWENSGQIKVTGTAGKVRLTKNTIDVGNSGLTLRLAAAVAALGSSPVIFTGDASICGQRPMAPLLSALKQLGVKADSCYGNGYAPLRICGPLHGGKVVVDGKDSQPVSGLLIAGSLASEPIEIEVVNRGEWPWVLLTLQWLDRLNLPYRLLDEGTFFLEGGAVPKSFSYTVPGDVSSAAFPVAAALVTGSELTVNNVWLDDGQGDQELFAIFKRMGASLTYSSVSRKLHVFPSRLQGITVDINACIDALPILAVVATAARGKTTIVNAAVARFKECNRIAATVSQLRAMGAVVEEKEDGCVVCGSALSGAAVHSFHDHRMAMALSVAGMRAEGATTIEGSECIAKTFPNFVEQMKKAGANLEESKN